MDFYLFAVTAHFMRITMFNAWRMHYCKLSVSLL